MINKAVLEDMHLTPEQMEVFMGIVEDLDLRHPEDDDDS